MLEVEKDETDKFYLEVTKADPKKKAFSGPLDDEQSRKVSERVDKRFEIERDRAFAEVQVKTDFLLKMQVPRAFR